MHLLVTRPRSDAARTARRLEELGHRVLAVPLMHIRPTGEQPDVRDVAALVFTSANGVHAFAAVSAERALPVFAVGAATAGAAREAGFTEIHAAEGDAAALADLIAARPKLRGKTLLHATGRHVAGDLSERLGGIALRRAVLYEAEAEPRLPRAIAEALGHGRPAPLDGVLLYSPRSARLFTELVRGAGLEESLSGLTAYCLSPAVAAALAGAAWRSVATADAATEDALLRLLLSHASTRGPGGR